MDGDVLFGNVCVQLRFLEQTGTIGIRLQPCINRAMAFCVDEQWGRQADVVTALQGIEQFKTAVLQGHFAVIVQALAGIARHFKLHALAFADEALSL